jgi:molybdopterin-guanine dinucleotide biosynthesis protein B
MKPTPVLGFAACSGVGKTTLLQSLIPLLKAQGLKIGLLKKSHHDFEIDQPGKDSYVLRKAGADAVLLSSPYRRALIQELRPAGERGLQEELACFGWADIDLILVEGYKHERFPKLELHRPALGKPLLFPGDASVIAIAADAPLPCVPPIPLFDLNAPAPIAAFILECLSHGTL